MLEANFLTECEDICAPGCYTQLQTAFNEDQADCFPTSSSADVQLWADLHAARCTGNETVSCGTLEPIFTTVYTTRNDMSLLSLTCPSIDSLGCCLRTFANIAEEGDTLLNNMADACTRNIPAACSPYDPNDCDIVQVGTPVVCSYNNQVTTHTSFHQANCSGIPLHACVPVFGGCTQYSESTCNAKTLCRYRDGECETEYDCDSCNDISDPSDRSSCCGLASFLSLTLEGDSVQTCRLTGDNQCTSFEFQQINVTDLIESGYFTLNNDFIAGHVNATVLAALAAEGSFFDFNIRSNYSADVTFDGSAGDITLGSFIVGCNAECQAAFEQLILFLQNAFIRFEDVFYVYEGGNVHVQPNTELVFNSEAVVQPGGQLWLQSVDTIDTLNGLEVFGTLLLEVSGTTIIDELIIQAGGNLTIIGDGELFIQDSLHIQEGGELYINSGNIRIHGNASATVVSHGEVFINAPMFDDAMTHLETIIFDIHTEFHNWVHFISGWVSFLGETEFHNYIRVEADAQLTLYNETHFDLEDNDNCTDISDGLSDVAIANSYGLHSHWGSGPQWTIVRGAVFVVADAHITVSQPWEVHGTLGLDQHSMFEIRGTCGHVKLGGHGMWVPQISSQDLFYRAAVAYFLEGRGEVDGSEVAALLPNYIDPANNDLSTVLDAAAEALPTFLVCSTLINGVEGTGTVDAKTDLTAALVYGAINTRFNLTGDAALDASTSTETPAELLTWCAGSARLWTAAMRHGEMDLLENFIDDIEDGEPFEATLLTYVGFLPEFEFENKFLFAFGGSVTDINSGGRMEAWGDVTLGGQVLIDEFGLFVAYNGTVSADEWASAESGIFLKGRFVVSGPNTVANVDNVVSSSESQLHARNSGQLVFQRNLRSHCVEDNTCFSWIGIEQDDDSDDEEDDSNDGDAAKLRLVQKSVEEVKAALAWADVTSEEEVSTEILEAIVRDAEGEPEEGLQLLFQATAVVQNRQRCAALASSAGVELDSETVVWSDFLSALVNATFEQQFTAFEGLEACADIQRAIVFLSHHDMLKCGVRHVSDDRPHVLVNQVDFESAEAEVEQEFEGVSSDVMGAIAWIVDESHSQISDNLKNLLDDADENARKLVLLGAHLRALDVAMGLAAEWVIDTSATLHTMGGAMVHMEGEAQMEGSVNVHPMSLIRVGPAGKLMMVNTWSEWQHPVTTFDDAVYSQAIIGAVATEQNGVVVFDNALVYDHGLVAAVTGHAHFWRKAVSSCYEHIQEDSPVDNRVIGDSSSEDDDIFTEADLDRFNAAVIMMMKLRAELYQEFESREGRHSHPQDMHVTDFSRQQVIQLAQMYDVEVNADMAHAHIVTELFPLIEASEECRPLIANASHLTDAATLHAFLEEHLEGYTALPSMNVDTHTATTWCAYGRLGMWYLKNHRVLTAEIDMEDGDNVLDWRWSVNSSQAIVALTSDRFDNALNIDPDTHPFEFIVEVGKALWVQDLNQLGDAEIVAKEQGSHVKVTGNVVFDNSLVLIDEGSLDVHEQAWALVARGALIRGYSMLEDEPCNAVISNGESNENEDNGENDSEFPDVGHGRYNLRVNGVMMLDPDGATVTTNALLVTHSGIVLAESEHLELAGPNTLWGSEHVEDQHLIIGSFNPMDVDNSTNFFQWNVYEMLQFAFVLAERDNSGGVLGVWQQFFLRFRGFLVNDFDAPIPEGLTWEEIMSYAIHLFLNYRKCSNFLGTEEITVAVLNSRMASAFDLSEPVFESETSFTTVLTACADIADAAAWMARFGTIRVDSEHAVILRGRLHDRLVDYGIDMDVDEIENPVRLAWAVGERLSDLARRRFLNTGLALGVPEVMLLIGNRAHLVADGAIIASWGSYVVVASDGVITLRNGGQLEVLTTTETDTNDILLLVDGLVYVTGENAMALTDSSMVEGHGTLLVVNEGQFIGLGPVRSNEDAVTIQHYFAPAMQGMSAVSASFDFIAEAFIATSVEGDVASFDDLVSAAEDRDWQVPSCIPRSLLTRFVFVLLEDSWACEQLPGFDELSDLQHDSLEQLIKDHVVFEHFEWQHSDDMDDTNEESSATFDARSMRRLRRLLENTDHVMNRLVDCSALYRGIFFLKEHGVVSEIDGRMSINLVLLSQLDVVEHLEEEHEVFDALLELGHMQREEHFQMVNSAGAMILGEGSGLSYFGPTRVVVHDNSIVAVEGHVSVGHRAMIELYESSSLEVDSEMLFLSDIAEDMSGDDDDDDDDSNGMHEASSFELRVWGTLVGYGEHTSISSDSSYVHGGRMLMNQGKIVLTGDDDDDDNENEDDADETDVNHYFAGDGVCDDQENFDYIVARIIAKEVLMYAGYMDDLENISTDTLREILDDLNIEVPEEAKRSTLIIALAKFGFRFRACQDLAMVDSTSDVNQEEARDGLIALFGEHAVDMSGFDFPSNQTTFIQVCGDIQLATIFLHRIGVARLEDGILVLDVERLRMVADDYEVFNQIDLDNPPTLFELILMVDENVVIFLDQNLCASQLYVHGRNAKLSLLDSSEVLLEGAHGVVEDGQFVLGPDSHLRVEQHARFATTSNHIVHANGFSGEEDADTHFAVPGLYQASVYGDIDIDTRSIVGFDGSAIVEGAVIMVHGRGTLLFAGGFNMRQMDGWLPAHWVGAPARPVSPTGQFNNLTYVPHTLAVTHVHAQNSSRVVFAADAWADNTMMEAENSFVLVLRGVGVTAAVESNIHVKKTEKSSSDDDMEYLLGVAGHFLVVGHRTSLTTQSTWVVPGGLLVNLKGEINFAESEASDDADDNDDDEDDEDEMPFIQVDHLLQGSMETTSMAKQLGNRHFARAILHWWANAYLNATFFEPNRERIVEQIEFYGGEVDESESTEHLLLRLAQFAQNFELCSVVANFVTNQGGLTNDLLGDLVHTYLGLDRSSIDPLDSAWDGAMACSAMFYLEHYMFANGHVHPVNTSAGVELVANTKVALSELSELDSSITEMIDDGTVADVRVFFGLVKEALLNITVAQPWVLYSFGPEGDIEFNEHSSTLITHGMVQSDSSHISVKEDASVFFTAQSAMKSFINTQTNVSEFDFNPSLTQEGNIAFMLASAMQIDSFHQTNGAHMLYGMNGHGSFMLPHERTCYTEDGFHGTWIDEKCIHDVDGGGLLTEVMEININNTRSFSEHAFFYEYLYAYMDSKDAADEYARVVSSMKLTMEYVEDALAAFEYDLQSMTRDEMITAFIHTMRDLSLCKVLLEEDSTELMVSMEAVVDGVSEVRTQANAQDSFDISNINTLHEALDVCADYATVAHILHNSDAAAENRTYIIDNIEDHYNRLAGESEDFTLDAFHDAIIVVAHWREMVDDNRRAASGLILTCTSKVELAEYAAMELNSRLTIGGHLVIHDEALLALDNQINGDGEVGIEGSASQALTVPLLYHVREQNEEGQCSFVELHGELKGNGWLDASSTEAEGGSLISPGFSTGTIEHQGDLVLTDNSTLYLEVAGPDDYDILRVYGTLVLDGELIIVGINGYELDPDEDYAVIQAVDFEGSFDNTNGNDVARFSRAIQPDTSGGGQTAQQPSDDGGADAGGDDDDDDDDDGLSGGVIAAIVIGSVVALAILILAIVAIKKRRSSHGEGRTGETYV